MAVVGSGIMADRLTDDGAVTLLANSAATAAALVVLVATLGPISGAHLNPVVSLVLMLRGALPARDAFFYAAVQVAGGVAGTIVAHAMFGLPAVALSVHARTGIDQWLSEGVAAFGLLTAILVAMVHRPGMLPAIVGLYIGGAYWFTGSTAFANPAVTIARTLTDTFSGIRPIDAPMFIVAQIAGALVASAFAGWLLKERNAD
jgi:glycerol uptake facilitator-like aquaporin